MSEKLIIRDNREEFANQIKEIVCDALRKEGFIKAEDSKYFCENYAIVFRVKGWFGRMVDKVFGEPGENMFYIEVMKIVSEHRSEETNVNNNGIKNEEDSSPSGEIKN